MFLIFIIYQTRIWFNCECLLKRKHIKIRFKASKVMRHKGKKWWQRTARWFSNKILHHLIARISCSWKSTFLRIPQHSGGMKTSNHCFLARNGTTFGQLRGFGLFFLSESISTPGQPISVVWCGVCERKCEIQIPRHWPDLFMSFLQKWTKFIVCKGRKFLEISIPGRARMLANAMCVNLES